MIKKANLSDPFHDFSKAELDSIVSKPKESLTSHDFLCVFQSHLPAGTYDECLYFVPLVINHIDSCVSLALSAKDTTEYLHFEDSVSDVIGNFFWWCEEYKDELSDGGNLQFIRIKIGEILTKTLSDFQLYKNKDGIYFPRLVNVAETLVYGISKYPFLFHMKDMLYSKLVLPNDYISSAWLITLSCLEKKYHVEEPVPSEIWGFAEKKNAISNIFSHLINKPCQEHLLYWENILSSMV